MAGSSRKTRNGIDFNDRLPLCVVYLLERPQSNSSHHVPNSSHHVPCNGCSVSTRVLLQQNRRDQVPKTQKVSSSSREWSSCTRSSVYEVVGGGTSHCYLNSNQKSQPPAHCISTHGKLCFLLSKIQSWRIHTALRQRRPLASSTTTQ